MKVLYVAREEFRHLTDGIGAFVPAPVAVADILVAVENLLESKLIGGMEPLASKKLRKS